MKKILVCAKSLYSGGVEVSLINFLKELSKNEYFSITLLLCDNAGFYKDAIPNNIDVIEIPFKNIYYNIFKTQVGVKKYIKKIFSFWGKLHNSTKIPFKYNNYILSKTLPLSNLKFDLAIDYHGYGYFATQYIITNVYATKKIMFLHDENIDWVPKINNVIDKFDYFFCVSNSCKNILEKSCGIHSDKVKVFHNILDYDLIKKKSEEYISFEKTEFDILTIGRLELQKGYDLLLDTASILKKKNKKFKWYIIGTGSMYKYLSNKIDELNLKNYVFLLGFIKNPYPYLRSVDLYVQTSLHEGYGLSIAEARILCKPIISTSIDCIKEQIKSGINGYLVDKNPSAISNKIIELSENPILMKKLVSQLQSETSSITNDLFEIDEILEDK